MTRVFNVKFGALDLTASPFMVLWDSLDQGAPENVVDVVQAFLVDGDIEVSPRSGNRTLSWTVGVEGANLLALATAEALLVTECEKAQNTLTITPGDGFSPASVFETFRASLVFQRNEAGEDANLRRFTVTLRALPWARSAAETVTGALTSGVSTTTVDTGASASGWSSTTAGAIVTTNSGDVVATVTAATVAPALNLTRTGSVNTTTTPYIAVDFAFGGGLSDTLSLDLRADGVLLPRLVGLAASPVGANYRRAVFQGGGTYGVLSFTGNTSEKVQVGASTALRIANIDRTDILPTIGTGRQVQRTLVVSGSARTQGSLSVQHETSALGVVLAYTRPDDGLGYSPPLRQYLNSTAGTPDAATVSGARNDPTSLQQYWVPYQSVPPGTYAIYARVRSTTATPQTFAWSARTMNPDASLSGPSTSGTKTVSYVGSSTWQIECLTAGLPLPMTDMPIGTGFSVSITIQQTTATGGPTCAIDEVWLFELGSGDLTIVDCGSNASPARDGSANRLWINTPTAKTPRWTLYRGFAANKSDAYTPDAGAISAYPTHVFPPGNLMSLTVTTNALLAATAFRAYNRWHTNAAT